MWPNWIWIMEPVTRWISLLQPKIRNRARIASHRPSAKSRRESALCYSCLTPMQSRWSRPRQERCFIFRPPTCPAGTRRNLSQCAGAIGRWPAFVCGGRFAECGCGLRYGGPGQARYLISAAAGGPWLHSYRLVSQRPGCRRRRSADRHCERPRNRPQTMVPAC